MTLEEMKLRKRQKGYSYAMIAELSGVPVGTVQKVFSGETKNPRYDTLQAIADVLKEEDKSFILNDSAAYDYGEDLKPEKKQGEYTLDDYYNLPEDVRAELIDGEIIIMEAPNTFHQEIIGEVYFQIQKFIKDNKGTCHAYISPIDVQLDCDNRTMVEPDVIIVCDDDKRKKRNIYGAPDFVLEVISPSTSRRDYFKKLSKYENAGVREYWIMDPYKKQMIVFFFEENIYARIYDLSEPIPINIYEGKLLIETEVLKQYCDELETSE
jgi:Uma2 family endonuclease